MSNNTLLDEVKINRKMAEALQKETGETYFNCLRALLKQSCDYFRAWTFLKYYSFDAKGNMVNSSRLNK